MEQLEPGTFETTLHHLINDHIDLSEFYLYYKNDSGGRTAYDPAILLKVILFAYSKGITSTREVQWQCEHNIIFKALSCDSVPHFTSIARMGQGKRSKEVKSNITDNESAKMTTSKGTIQGYKGCSGCRVFCTNVIFSRISNESNWNNIHAHLSMVL